MWWLSEKEWTRLTGRTALAVQSVRLPTREVDRDLLRFATNPSGDANRRFTLVRLAGDVWKTTKEPVNWSKLAIPNAPIPDLGGKVEWILTEFVQLDDDSGVVDIEGDRRGSDEVHIPEARRDLKEEALSFERQLTYKPMNPYCKICAESRSRQPRHVRGGSADVPQKLRGWGGSDRR